ncbi:hypothetical protein JCM10207_004829 [Rhodosporidiobolus poonsookiae]
MPGQLRLALWGLLIGLLAAFYPQLPSYLPSSVSSKLPFLPTHGLDTPSGKRWTGSLHRYQAGVPIAPDFEHSKEAEWEAEIEKQLRFGSKQGGREMEKEFKRQMREVEMRAEHAGDENRIRDALPVYFVEQGSDVDVSALAAVGEEIDAFEPRTVILLAPFKTSTAHLLVSTSSEVSSASPPVSFGSSPTVARALLTRFAHHGTSGVAAAGSSLASLSPSAARVLGALNLHKDTHVVQVLLPVLPKDQGGWTAEQWAEAGRAVAEVLHEKEKGRKDRLAHKSAMILALGTAAPKNPSPSFPALLDSALAHHTSRARDLALVSLYSSAGGSKPQKAVREGLVALFAATGAAGEDEGHALPGGVGWRFGALPIR